MAKGAYIGITDIARKIKKGYIGVNGIARKIKKAYIGDENGRARLCYTAETEWERYSATSTTVYQETKEQKQKGITHTNSYGSYLKFFWSSQYTFNEKTGQYTLVSPKSDTYVAFTITYGQPQNVFKEGVYVGSSSTTNELGEVCTGTDYNSLIFKYTLGSEQVTNYSKGSYIDTVASDNENAYPDDGYQDGYWYVKKK